MQYATPDPLRSCEQCDCHQINSGQCEQDCGHRAKLHHLELLPLAVAERYQPWLLFCQSHASVLLLAVLPYFLSSLVIEWCNKHGKTRDLETVCYSLAGDPDCDHKVSVKLKSKSE